MLSFWTAGELPDEALAPNARALAKTLLLDTDDTPEVSADLEGMTLLDERTLLLVNDNDFGIEGVATTFWRVEFAEPI